MRNMRWIELLKDYDFGLNFYLGKANVVTNALSRETLHMSTLMARELELIQEIRDLNLIDDNGVIKFRDKICVPDMPKLKKNILEGHQSDLSSHPGATKMYQDLRKMFSWPGMKKEIVKFMLTKSAHFIPMRLDYSSERLDKLYINKIVNLHGIPSRIVSDKVLKFTSRFLESLQMALGMKLHMNSAYHPQIDGQTRMTIQLLEDLLRACVLDQ
ncbi:uncharacterized protein LOC127131141 [Lathyrus oleraceus]|uniref:uncharacterized protein LOC127131141 n=1 Tax=Pisum sativum TaxID=3888 RepID=UPI0021CF52B1|nr:uncharacterized protein LOC127131141 [Pisum sativum]